MDMSLKVFLEAVISSLPTCADQLVNKFLPVFFQSLCPCMGVAATCVTFLSLLFVAYKWKQNPNSDSSEKDGGDGLTPLEERLKQSYILDKQLENELETARRDLEVSGRTLWQKDEEVNEITQKLKKMTEEHNNQQSLLQESKREAESLMKENKELKKKLTEAETGDAKQQSEAEILQQLKTEQQKREEAEKSLQELKAELDTKTQKLVSFSKRVEILHEMMKKTEESQQVLMKELKNHKDQQETKDPEQSAAAEEPNLENMTPEITELRKELRDAQAQSEVLTEQNQQLEAQLADLKERYKQEMKTLIAEEQKWREELERNVKVLRKEYENKKKLRTIQKEAESETSEEVSAPAEEEKIHEEDS